MNWRRKREQDLNRELRSHLEAESEEQRDRHAAQRALGNLGRIKEDVREAWGWTWLDRFSQDVRYALRTMRQSILMASHRESGEKTHAFSTPSS